MKIEVKITCTCGNEEVIGIKRWCDLSSEYFTDKEYAISESIKRLSSSYDSKADAPDSFTIKCTKCSGILNVTT